MELPEQKSQLHNPLVDIRTVNIDPALPTAEKLTSFVSQVHDPYCFMVGDVTVHISFAQKANSLTDCFSALLSTM